MASAQQHHVKTTSKQSFKKMLRSKSKTHQITISGKVDGKDLQNNTGTYRVHLEFVQNFDSQNRIRARVLVFNSHVHSIRLTTAD